MKTQIIKKKGDWLEVLNDCRSTVGKAYATKEPSDKFKQEIVIAEHSPIRDISIKWMWSDIKSWVATHFVRHKWECFVLSQRDDRTGIPRDKKPQDSLVDFTGEANIQHLIDTSRKRLCYCASSETREYWEDLKHEISLEEPIISRAMVPNCIYRCGCPEILGCGLYSRFKEYLASSGNSTDMSDIWNRYSVYEEFRNSER